MLKVFGVIITICIICKNHYTFAGLTQINTVNFQEIQESLLSIDNRLKNLENVIKVRNEQYDRIFDNIEKNLSRLQIDFNNKLDGVAEQTNIDNFKSDVARVVDDNYEKINHKLTDIQRTIDVGVIKYQKENEVLIAKLEKMEESLSIRDADLEAEISDVATAIDDLKMICISAEETYINVTKELTETWIINNEKMFRKHYVQTENILENANLSLTTQISNIQNSIIYLSKETNGTLDLIKLAKNEFEEALNEYANKMIDLYTEVQYKSDVTYKFLQNLMNIANVTRNEQQNGLRALMVLIGRKNEKQVPQTDLVALNNKLQELNKMIDKNFENVLGAQNLFLESCYRVQMDEAQLETQISTILEKLIDIFENKTSVGPKDISHLAQLIQTHDSNTKKNMHQITNNLLALAKKTVDENDKIMESMYNQQGQLTIITAILQEIPNFDVNTKQNQDILKELQIFQEQLNVTNNMTHSQLAFISKFLKSLKDAGIKDEITENVYDILERIEEKINKPYIDNFINKILNFNIRLNDKPQIDKKISKLLSDIFNNSDENDEVEDIVSLHEGTNETVKSNKINNTNEDLSKQNKSDLIIFPEKTIDSYTIESNNHTNNSCLPNYRDLIDVRSNYDVDDNTNSKCNTSANKAKLQNNSKTSQIEFPTETEVDLQQKVQTKLYDIDVRYEATNTDSKHHTNTKNVDFLLTENMPESHYSITTDENNDGIDEFMQNKIL